MVEFKAGREAGAQSGQGWGQKVASDPEMRPCIGEMRLHLEAV